MNLRKSIIWNSPNNISLLKDEIPKIKKGELLIKVNSCGVCGSDLKIIKHGNHRVKKGRIIGHEISGTIIESLSDKKFDIGDRVVVGADIPCGECFYCKHDMSNCCEINYAVGHQFDGGFSQYLKLNELTVNNGPIQKIDEHVTFEAATLAEPLACCINGYEVANAKHIDTVVIFGGGPIGMMLASLAPTYGAKTVILIDPNQKRLNQIIKLGLADHIINPLNEDVKKKVMDVTKNIGSQLIFTATTAKESHELAISLISRRGVVNLFGGLPKNAGNISLNSNWIHYREAYITGSHGSTPLQNVKALKLISSGAIEAEKFITHSYSIENFNKAIATANNGEAIKIIIKPNL